MTYREQSGTSHWSLGNLTLEELAAHAINQRARPSSRTARPGDKNYWPSRRNVRLDRIQIPAMNGTGRRSRNDAKSGDHFARFDEPYAMARRPTGRAPAA